MEELKLKIFFSYSHKDESFCIDLQKHLKPLKRADLISHWYDRELKAGDNWDENIKLNLLTADIVLFLVSPDFLNSEYIYENEIKLAVERHKNAQSLVVPIMLRKCDIEYTPFKDIQGLPTDLEPINSNKWYTVDDAYFNVVEGLKKIIHRERNKREVLFSEEYEWKKAIEKNTIESYLLYLENSKLKTKFDDVIKRVNQLKVDKYRDEFEFTNIELQIQEKERKLIARDLHDDVGSLLSVAKVLVSSLDPKNEIVVRLTQVIDETINSIRKISHSLRTDTSKSDFNLKKAILDLESKMIHSDKIKLELNFVNIDDLSNNQLEVNIYRIIQELVSNIIHHSNASLAFISISNIDNEVRVRVKDNGVGISETAINQGSQGAGLENIKSRIDYYSGELKITSIANVGTEINFTIPI